MGKGIGLLANAGYIYKILTDPGTLTTPGVLDMQGFKGYPGSDAYQTWLAAGNVGTIEEFFAAIGGLVVNNVRATYNIDKIGAEFVNYYSDADVVLADVKVQGVVKYVITYQYNLNGDLEWRQVTRDDNEWFRDTYEYDAEGIITRTVPTEG